MKNATRLLCLLLLCIAANALHAQNFNLLQVPSYQREQPFLFCGALAQAEPLTVPFDLINPTGFDIVIDSVIATGDTADFYANGIPGSGEYYLNPVMWKYVSGRTIPPYTTVFNSFYFAPKSPGTKQLDLIVYFHESDIYDTARATFTFTTADAPAGLGFLALKTDTVSYAPPGNYRVVTYDRTVTQDTLFISDTLDLYDTLRAKTSGEERIDLYSCNGSTVVEIQTTNTSPNPFEVFMPATPFTIASGESMLVDFKYTSQTVPQGVQTMTIRFITADEQALMLYLTVYPRFTGSVDGPDERGSLAGARMRSMPNPFTGSTTIRLGMDHPGDVQLVVMNALGEQVALLHDGRVEAGEHELRFDAAGLPAGIYFARLESGGKLFTRPLVLTR